jgi:hypothetical protein
MSLTVPPIKLLRYLFVLRVNSTLVRLAPCPPANFAYALACVIADRLSTAEAKPWRKAVATWEGHDMGGDGDKAVEPVDPRTNEARANQRGVSTLPKGKPMVGALPDAVWPIDAAIHVYPGKQIYGQGEQILWELKLLGGSAEHALFLEILLPAIEAAGSTRHARWQRGVPLWGHYDIDEVYVGQGLRWQPLVQQGKLDFALQPSASQWRSELPLQSKQRYPPRTLTWLTPFAFAQAQAGEPANAPRPEPRPPDLRTILSVAGERIERYAPGWLNAGPGDKASAWQAVLQQAQASRVVSAELYLPPKGWPGQGLGEQSFNQLPQAAIPYLTLASILHIGDYAHWGYGSFALSQ